MIKYKYSKLAKRILPLVSWDMLIELQRTNRLTGKTTAMALSLLAQSMLSPEKVICLSSYTGLTHPQLYCSGGFIEVLRNSINSLGLDYFTLSTSRCTLTYNPYGYVTKDWVVVE